MGSYGRHGQYGSITTPPAASSRVFVSPQGPSLPTIKLTPVVFCLSHEQQPGLYLHFPTANSNSVIQADNMCFGFKDTEYEAIPPPRRVRTVRMKVSEVKLGTRFRAKGVVYQYIWNGEFWVLHQIVSMNLGSYHFVSSQVVYCFLLGKLFFLAAFGTHIPPYRTFLAGSTIVHAAFVPLFLPGPPPINCVVFRSTTICPTNRTSDNKQPYPADSRIVPLINPSPTKQSWVDSLQNHCA